MADELNGAALRPCDRWLLDLLYDAALANKRCPANAAISRQAKDDRISFGPTDLADALNRLRSASLIKVEISGQNYRRLYVRLSLNDPWLATAANPAGHRPHLVLS